MALGLLASIGIPFVTDLLKNYGEKAVVAGVEKVTGIDLSKQELTIEEKQRILDAEVQIREVDFKELELVYKDVGNSRGMNIEIQKSDKASWLAKNTGYILDFMVIGSTIVLAFSLFWLKIPLENKELAYTVFGALLALSTTSFQFHRGSSVGSKDKTQNLVSVIKELR